MINLLNPKIRGWANYFRNAVSSRAFSYVDYMVYTILKSWILRRHPNKSKSWTTKKYYIRRGLNNWNFHAMVKDKKGNKIPLYLYKASETSIRRHIKIRSEVSPFNPVFKDYFKHRDKTDNIRLTVDDLSPELSIKLLGGNAALPRT